MSFATGLILGSMMSRKEHSFDTPNTYRDLTSLEFLYFLVFICIMNIIIIYVFCIRDERKKLNDAINNLVHCTTTAFLTDIFHPQRCEVRTRRNRIQRIIEVLEEKPAFFGSPLYIAKSSLRMEIKSKLDELKLELKNLDKEISNIKTAETLKDTFQGMDTKSFSQLRYKV